MGLRDGGPDTHRRARPGRALNADPTADRRPAERFLEARAQLIAAALPGPGAARALSDAADRCVTQLADAALGPQGGDWCVVALGGWGARRLLPHSDLDLLVLHDGGQRRLREAVEALLYPLWDAGLAVGHQVRTPKEHARACRGDIRALTATLTGRFLCGDARLASATLETAAGAASRRAGAIRQELAARERPGSPYLLEPDLKCGCGGQRDLDELTWLAAALSGRPARSPAPLARLGLLTTSDSRALRSAGRSITAARWAVQSRAVRHTSTLTIDAGIEEVLDLEALQSALADVHHLLEAVRRRGAAPAARGSALSADELFELLDRGPDAVPDLERAAWEGRLDDLAPSLGDLMHVRRPALSHRYTVGAHSLRCAAAVAEEAAGAGAPGEELEPGMLRTVQVAALLHDFGKARNGAGHEERGAQATLAVAGRFGLPPHAVRDAATLVREHLLLPSTAFGADTRDEDVLLRAAATVRREELLAPLRALTVADSKATGPGAWTTWHAALVDDLVRMLRPVLRSRQGTTLVKRADEVKAEAVATVSAEGHAALTAYLAAAPVRYLAASSAHEVALHARLAEELARSMDPRHVALGVTPGPADGLWRASIMARPAPGLFAAACAACALAGLDIVDAQLASPGRELALQVFTVRSDTLAPVGVETWPSLTRALRGALIDPAGCDARLAQRGRAYRRQEGSVPTRVWADTPDTGGTRLTVRTRDRVGLLHDIARAIDESGLEVLWARAVTQDAVARDVFRVADPGGETVADPGSIGHLVMHVRERIAGRP